MPARNFDLEKAQKQLALAKLDEEEAMTQVTWLVSYPVFPANDVSKARWEAQRAKLRRELAQIAVDEISAKPS